MTTTDEAREAAARIGHLEARLTGSGAFINLAIASFLGAVAIVCALLWFLAGVHAPAFAFCMLLLFPISLVIGVSTLAQYLGKRPTLAMDPQGLHHLMLGSIAWRDVVGVALTTTQGQSGGLPMLALGLVPGARLQGGVPWSTARGPNLRIGLRGLDRSPADILAMAEALRDQVSPPRLRNWHYGMSPDAQAAFQESQRLLDGFERLAHTDRARTAAEEAELLELSQALEPNSAALVDAAKADVRRFRLRMWLILAGLGLVTLLMLWRLVARISGASAG